MINLLSLRRATGVVEKFSVSINYLTRTNYELLRKTRKHQKILNCWTTDGKVTAIIKSSYIKVNKMFINSLQEHEML